MQVNQFEVSGPLLIAPSRHSDARGFFSEVYRQDLFEAHVGPTTFVQDNHSLSRNRGTIRGLHYQAPPHAQGKLVRVTAGAVLDVIVDARIGSPTYGRHLEVELSASNGHQLWVPPGFLHGFCTLANDTEFLYKVTDYYAPECDGAVRFDDPGLAIKWPVTGTPEVSDKDRRAPSFADMAPVFTWNG